MDVRGDDLAVAVVRGLIERSGVDPTVIEDVVLGCTQQTGEQGLNLGRMVALMADLPVTTGGTTINRLCGSSLQALNQACHAIAFGAEDVQVVGGVEHMHHLPMDHGLDLNPKLFRHTSKGALMMGVTAEFLAQSQGISREDQDQFALSSHHKAIAAHESGAFAEEVVPVWGRSETGERTLVDFDQCVRADTSLDALAALKPAFMPGIGTVTAGNSSPLNDRRGSPVGDERRAGGRTGTQAAGQSDRDRSRGRRSVRHGHRSRAGGREGPATRRRQAG